MILPLPDVLLFLSLALMSRWDYAATIGLLQKYISVPNLDPYQSHVGRINLIAALIYEGSYGRAAELLQTLLIELSDGKWPLLQGYALELAAQNSIFLGQWDEAQKHLTQGQEALRDSTGIEGLFIQKWKVVLELRRYGSSPHRIARLATERMGPNRRAG